MSLRRARLERHEHLATSYPTRVGDVVFLVAEQAKDGFDSVPRDRDFGRGRILS
jgi:hypothetical protein